MKVNYNNNTYKNIIHKVNVSLIILIFFIYFIYKIINI